MEPSVTSPHLYRLSNGPPPPLPTPQTQPQRHPHDREDGDTEDGWSGQEQESCNEVAGDRKHSQSSDRGVKRKRPVMVSCELCKQRKVKCDRAQPSCGWCSRNGQICEYKERKKPGLRAGYGRELEQRLDRLEEIIQAQAHLINTHIIQNQPRPNNEVLTQQSNPYSSPSDRSGVLESSPRDVLLRNASSSTLPPPPRNPASISSYNQDYGMSTPPDTSYRNAMQHQYQNDLPAPPVLPSSAETPRSDYAHNDTPSLKMAGPPAFPSNQTHNSLADSDTDLPPYDLLYSLVDLYFENINTWCPILHRRTTLDAFFGPSPLKEEDRMLLYAVVATTLRFSRDVRLNDENRKRYYDSSKRKVLLYGLDNSSVTALQALVVLAVDFVGSSNGPPGWKLLALIARSVVQLGLAVESTSSLVANMFPSIYTLRANILPDSRTWVEDEGRRRLFWMAYLLDRYSTIATAFDFALDEKEIDRRLPCKDIYFSKNQPVETRWFETQERTDYFAGRENIGSFGFYVEVLGILSRIHLFLKRPVDISAAADVEEWQSTYRKLDNELTAWEYHLPAEYSFAKGSRYLSPSKSSKSIDCGWIMLQTTYQTTVIRLHSSAAYPTTRSPIFNPSYSAIQRCLTAVERIRLITQFVVDQNILSKLGPPFAFSLWVSARLLLVNGSTVAHTLDHDIKFFFDTLRRMGCYWKVAERYSTILQRVLDEYAEYEQSLSSGAAERTTPSCVKILADMRRCAFDLDILISRQPSRSGQVATAASNTPRNSTTPLQSRSVAPHELEYLDVFGFFNVPRIPNAGGNGTVPPNHHGQAQTQSSLDGMGVVGHSGGTHNNGSLPGMSIADLTGPSPTVASAQASNQYNITDYMIPTPETDWLFRAAT